MGHRKSEGQFTELLIYQFPVKVYLAVLVLNPILTLPYTKHLTKVKIQRGYCISLLNPSQTFRRHTLINEPMHKLWYKITLALLSSLGEHHIKQPPLFDSSSLQLAFQWNHAANPCSPTLRRFSVSRGARSRDALQLLPSWVQVGAKTPQWLGVESAGCTYSIY